MSASVAFTAFCCLFSLALSTATASDISSLSGVWRIASISSSVLLSVAFCIANFLLALASAVFALNTGSSLYKVVVKLRIKYNRFVSDCQESLFVDTVHFRGLLTIGRRYIILCL